jgi:hypothetical protein
MRTSCRVRKAASKGMLARRSIQPHFQKRRDQPSRRHQHEPMERRLRHHDEGLDDHEEQGDDGDREDEPVPRAELLLQFLADGRHGFEPRAGRPGFKRKARPRG